MLEVDSLEELLNLVRIKNPDLKSYELNVIKSSYEVKTTKAALLPSVTGTFSGQKNVELATTPVPGELFGQPGTTVNAQFGQEYAYNAGISLTKNLLDRQSTLKMKIAKLNYEAAEVQQDLYLQLLEQQVTLNYYSILISKRSIFLSEKDVETADSIALLSQQKFDEGLLDALTMNQARINSYVTKQNLNNGKQLYNQAIDDLKLLLGKSNKDSLIVVASMQYELPPTHSINELMADESIKLAKLDADQARIQVKIQKSMFIPKLSLNSYFGKQQFREEFGFEFGNNEWSDFAYVGLNLSVPIFAGFSNQNKLKTSKLELDWAENELNKANLESQMQDVRLIEDYHSSLINTQLSLETFHLYEQNERLTHQKYSEGLISLDRYLNAFEDYLKAEIALLNTLLNTYSYYSQIIPRIQQQ
jgi:outer membrane protein TolC